MCCFVFQFSIFDEECAQSTQFELRLLFIMSCELALIVCYLYEHIGTELRITLASRTCVLRWLCWGRSSRYLTSKFDRTCLIAVILRPLNRKNIVNAGSVMEHLAKFEFSFYKKFDVEALIRVAERHLHTCDSFKMIDQRWKASNKTKEKQRYQNRVLC